MDRYYWTGYSSKDKWQMIHEIEGKISPYGFIVDFKEFSDISISLIIELEQQKIAPLYQDLKGLLRLEEFDIPTTGSSKECVVLMHISFTYGSGRVRKEVLASE